MKEIDWEDFNIEEEDYIGIENLKINDHISFKYRSSTRYIKEFNVSGKVQYVLPTNALSKYIKLYNHSVIYSYKRISKMKRK